jgi:hypothetical protein
MFYTRFFLVSFAEELKAMFAQDLFLKKMIIEDIRNQVDRDILLMYISVWLMSPYLNTNRIHFIFSAVETESQESNGFL